MGRVSISVGRRLGEIYDKIPRLLAAARFSLAPEEVAPKINGLELDTGLLFDRLDGDDVQHVSSTVIKHIGALEIGNGIGVEVRYNFNPNDSARLRKDVAMAEGLQQEGLLPIYLVFSAISPRDEAIARLTRAGWRFLVGEKALKFSHDLYGVDLTAILRERVIKHEIEREVSAIMDTLFGSHAFTAVMADRQ